MHYSSTNRHIRDPVPLIEFCSCIFNILLLPRVFPSGFSHSTDNAIIKDYEIEINIPQSNERKFPNFLQTTRLGDLLLMDAPIYNTQRPKPLPDSHKLKKLYH